MSVAIVTNIRYVIMMIMSVHICTQVSFVPAGDDNDFVVEYEYVVEYDYVDNDGAPDHDNYECTQVAFVPADCCCKSFQFRCH